MISRVFGVVYLIVGAFVLAVLITRARNDHPGTQLVVGGGTSMFGSGLLRDLGSGEYVSQMPPTLPAEDCGSYATSAEQWECFYRQNVRDFQGATRSGFRSPGQIIDEGDTHLVEVGSALGHIDWDHPVGFAIIDCDRHSMLLDGSGSARGATIEWDPKRACLRVLDVLPRRTR